MIFSQELIDIMTRLLAAGGFGAIIGIERDIHGRAAGLRTNILVAVGAALFMIVSEHVGRMGSGGNTSFDPGRIAAQVVSGIGFLGAGAIIKEGFNVKGLTTAACLWLVAAIGLASGAAMYSTAAITTASAIFALVALNYVERSFSKDSYRNLVITTDQGATVSSIIDIVKRKNVRILYCDYEKDYENNQVRVSLALRLFHKGMTDKLSHAIIRDLEASKMVLKSVNWYH